MLLTLATSDAMRLGVDSGSNGPLLSRQVVLEDPRDPQASRASPAPQVMGKPFPPCSEHPHLPCPSGPASPPR